MPPPIAKPIRAASSLAEHRLWSRLVGGQLPGLEFQRQAQVGPCVADFLCLDARLVIEVDGPVAGQQVAAEFARARYFERVGLEVLRFTDGQVLEDLEWVLGAIRLVGERAALAKQDRSRGPFRMAHRLESDGPVLSGPHC